MVGQVIRAVEVPISLSVGVARRGAVLAGRVAGWAVTGIVRELSPDKRENRPAPATDDSPLAEAARTPAWEPVAAREAVTEEAKPVAPIEEKGETAPVSGTESEAAPARGAEAAPSGKEDIPPGEDGAVVEHEPAVVEHEPAVVEHEPGIGTSVRARDPHSALSNPVTDADMTEWPDPYDHREDPRDPGEEMAFGGDAGHTQTGATSTSEPHPSHDPEAEPWEGPKRDKVDQ